MSKPTESEDINLQIDNVNNNVLDSVLEHIDGLLMDNIPNPALTPLPPLPQSKECYHNNHSNNNNNNELQPIPSQYKYNNDDDYYERLKIKKQKLRDFMEHQPPFIPP
eukprot:724917_1